MSAAIRTRIYLLLLAVAPALFFARGTRMEVMLGNGDAFVQFLPFWTHAAREWSSGTAPFWTPYIFGGYPLLAEPQASVFHPLKLLFLFVSPLAAMNLTVLLYYALAGIFTFLAAREEELTPEAALLAGLAFSFCGFLIGHQAITPLFMTAACFPLSFYALRRALRKSDYSSILVGALAIVLLVISGHPQFMFYSLFFGLFYAAYLFMFVADKSQRMPFVKTAAGIYLLGPALAAFQLFPTYQLMTHSVRDRLAYENFVAVSLPAPSLVTSLISTRLHHLFINDGSESMVDVGVPVILLAILGVFLSPPRARFWIFLSLFSALLFLGDTGGLYPLMFHLPGYNLFQVASRNGIVLDFALAMLAACGLSALQTRPPAPLPGLSEERLASRLRLAATLLLAPSIYYLGMHRMEERVFRSLWEASSGRAEPFPWDMNVVRAHLIPLAPEIGLWLIAGGLLIFLLARIGSTRLTAPVLITLAFLHFWTYRDWIFAAPAQQVRESLALDMAAAGPLADPSLSRGQYRVAMGASDSWIGFLASDAEQWWRRYLAVAGADLNLLYKIPTISGYSPLILRDYSRLAGDMHMSGYVRDPRFFTSPALNLLNVKYVLVPAGEPGQPAFPEETFSRLEPVSRSDLVAVYRNPGAPGMFWGIRDTKVASREEFWAELDKPAVDFSKVALLTGGNSGQIGSRSFGLPTRIDFRQKSANTMELSVTTPTEAFLASSHPAYPGWFVWIDGKRTPAYEVNGLFAGLRVPPGRHEIVLRFIPVSFWLGAATGLLALLIFCFIAARDRRVSARAAGRGREPAPGT